MAADTLHELESRKVVEILRFLDSPVGVIPPLRVALADWTRRVTIVKVPGNSLDKHVAEVVKRDPWDFATAMLATILAPCVLATKDRDFEALELQ